ncbi:MAG: hypothetical protein MK212_01325 [Saprospiraceae bacterium]|nr:hypothetical protein [Saprospiraceae bacterium]
MQFKEIIGHQKLQKHLIETYQAGRTAHAQIFLGTEGCGKLAMAIAYAQYLLCESPQAEDSCGVCNSCRKVQKLIHPDLHFSYPVVGSGKISTSYIKEWRTMLLENAYPSLREWQVQLGAEQQKCNITKNECVDIVRKFSLKSVEGAYKILILWLPEFLEKEGNRLLKLIEEPAPNTVFILVAEQQEKILNTILSRCQLLRVNRLESQEIQSYLIQQYSISEEKAQFAAHLAEGNWNRAKKLAEETSSESHEQLFMDWLRICYRGHGRDLVSWTEGVCSGKDFDKKEHTKLSRGDQSLFFQYGLYFLREYTLLKLTADTTKIRLQAGILQAAQKLTKVLSVAQAQKLSLCFDEAIYHLERNINPKILFLDVSIRVHKILKNR